MKDGTGPGLGWPDDVGPGAVVPVGSGDAGAVVDGLALGLSVGVLVGLAVGAAVVAGLDGFVGCDVGVRGGAGGALWIDVLVGAGVPA